MDPTRTLELLECPPSGKAVGRMTPKGHSPVDLDSAEPATSRRTLLATLGTAGLAGALAVAVAQPATAAPNSPTPGDRDLLGQALRLELTARRLYRAPIEAGLSGDAAEVARVFSKNHEYYADQFAAITGISANEYDEAAFEDNADAFDTSDVGEFAIAAWTLENNAAATYAELLNELESVEAQRAVASIAVMNARMATVLADLAGVSDDFEILFDPPGEAITLGAASDGETS